MCGVFEDPFYQLFVACLLFLQMFQHYNTGSTVHTAQWGGQAAPREGIFLVELDLSLRGGGRLKIRHSFCSCSLVSSVPHPTPPTPKVHPHATRRTPILPPCHGGGPAHSRERGTATEEGGGAKSCPKGCVHRGDTSLLHPSKCRIKRLCDVT